MAMRDWQLVCRKTPKLSIGNGAAAMASASGTRCILGRYWTNIRYEKVRVARHVKASQAPPKA